MSASLDAMPPSAYHYQIGTEPIIPHGITFSGEIARYVFVSGQGGTEELNDKGVIVRENLNGTSEEETARAVDNIGKLLKTADSEVTNMTQAIVYVTNFTEGQPELRELTKRVGHPISAEYHESKVIWNFKVEILCRAVALKTVRTIENKELFTYLPGDTNGVSVDASQVEPNMVCTGRLIASNQAVPIAAQMRDIFEQAKAIFAANKTRLDMTVAAQIEVKDYNSQDWKDMDNAYYDVANGGFTKTHAPSRASLQGEDGMKERIRATFWAVVRKS